jgi:glycosyltransferase involved in cell wall biosynthesis
MIVEGAGVPEAKVVVIPNAVDTARFTYPPVGTMQLRRELAPLGERLLLSVGRISAQKRMHLIPSALSLLKREGRLPAHLRVCILGQVEDAMSQRQLEAAIVEAGLEDIVIQRPVTPTPEAYYHSSDATVLYTVKEGISIAMLESLASGRPVIISEEANAAGIIEHGRTGWIVPTDDLARFAQTLAEVVAVPEETLREMGPACVERSQSFSIEALSGRYSDLYASLLV